MLRTALCAVALVAVGCAGEARDQQVDSGTIADTRAVRAADSLPAADTTPTATALVRDARGRDLGTITLRETAAGLSVSGSLRGLPPLGHGVHLHTVGKCEPPFQSAGGHWNPTNRQHGMLNPQGPHLGDLPNVVAGADSTATMEGTTPGGTLSRTNSLLDGDGAALVIHARPDDYRTDPSGNSGDPIACGVVSSK